MDKTIGERIKRRRFDLKLTQSALAKRIGVLQSAVSMVETNSRKPTVETLEKLADGLECSTDYLLGRSEK